MSEKATYLTCCLADFRNTSGPIIDVRCPGEFSQGHLPGAINLPLFSNEERAIVGKTYKTEGREKAILIGLQITNPKLMSFKKVLEKLNIQEIQTLKSNKLLRPFNFWQIPAFPNC